MNRNSSLFNPLHALAGGPKQTLGFLSPFGPSGHDPTALRHLDPFGLRPMNPAQLFAGQSPFSPNNPLGRPPPTGFDPMTALLLESRYRSMMPPFPNPSASPIIPPLSSSSSSAANGTHNHAHIHSHSHTHLHLGNNNDSSSSSPASNSTNGPPLLPAPPPPLMPFGNPLAG